MADSNRRTATPTSEVDVGENIPGELQADTRGLDPDHASASITAAIAQIIDDVGRPRPDEISGGNSQFYYTLRSLTETEAQFKPDSKGLGGLKHPDILKLEVARKKSIKDNSFAYKAADDAALGTFQAAWFVWQQARDDYTFSLESAQADLQTAANAAMEVYADKWNEDSPVQNAILYARLQATVAAALTTYQGVAASAGGSLAAAGGTMLTAYATLISSKQAAEMAQISSDFVASATFWESVQALRSS